MVSKLTRSGETTTDLMAIDKAGYNPPPVARVHRPNPSPPSPPLSPTPSGPKERV